MTEDARPTGQERVLRAAIEVIAERGFRAASTSEIARRAGVAEGTIFRHFKTKELLLTHIVEPFFEHVIAPLTMREFRPLVQAEYASFAAFLRAVARDRLALAQRERPVLRILLQELPLRPELRALIEKHVAGRLIPEMIAAVRRFQERGEVDPTADPAAVVRMMITTFAGYAVVRHLVLPERAWDDGAETERMVQTLARGLRPP